MKNGRSPVVRVVAAMMALLTAAVFIPRSAYAAVTETLSPEEIAAQKQFEYIDENADYDAGFTVGLIDGAKTQRDAAMPSRFDLRDQDRLTSVKYQGDFGTCWAFSALGSAESTLISKGYADTSVDLSEKHLAYFTYANAPDKLGNTRGDWFQLKKDNYLAYGGTIPYSTATLSSWIGAVGEYDLPGLALDPHDISQVNQTFPAETAYSLDRYHMTDCLWLSPQDSSALKRYLREYGAGQMCIYWNDTYYNYTNHAYYCTNYHPNCNHQVLLCGWDDNYSRNNFTQKPKKDGAWLCRNTWGTEWGDDGFFWCSYEDFCFGSGNDNVIAFNCFEPVGNDKNIYQYDGGRWIDGISSARNTKSGQFAAIYTADSDDELLDRVSFFTRQPNVSYSVDVYTDVKNNPTDGVRAFEMPLTGVLEASGYHSVDIPELLPLRKGERFSVVVRLTSGDGSAVILPIDENLNYSDCTLHSECRPGETFYRIDLDTWTDASSDRYTMRVKAVTVSVSDDLLYSADVIRGSLVDTRTINGKLLASQTVSAVADKCDTDLERFSHWEVSYPDDPDDPFVPDEPVEPVVSDSDADDFEHSDDFADVEPDYYISDYDVSASDVSCSDIIGGDPDELEAVGAPRERIGDVDPSWTVELSDSRSERVTFEMPARDITLTAVFDKIRYSAAISRMAGDDRYATSAEISRNGWESSEVVLIASGENYPDALAAAPLAKKYDAPILLTASKKLSDNVISELNRLMPDRIIIIGGTSAVSADVESRLSSMCGRVERIAGDDRFMTAAMIADRLGSTDNCFFVSGRNYPDALSVSVVAAKAGVPILYLEPSGMVPSGTAAYLAGMDITDGVIIGGTAAVDTLAEVLLLSRGIHMSRLYGDDRFETSLAICNEYLDLFNGNAMLLATGKNYPDALSGAALAAKLDMPVVLTSDKAGNALGDFADAYAPDNVYIAGGSDVVPSEILYDLFEIK